MKEKGITLIALVVTIVVLLILAGVSISMLTGENGIITQAQEAKDDTEQARVQELVDLAVNSLIGENMGSTNGITPQMVAEEVNEMENRNDVYAEGSEFPTKIIFPEEEREVEVDLEQKVDLSEMYEVAVDEDDIAPLDLFDYEIIDDAEVGALTLSTLPTKNVRITGIKEEYCNHYMESSNTVEDTNYEIIYEGTTISDTLVIPYEVDGKYVESGTEGEMYKITEVSLMAPGKMYYGRVEGYSIPKIQTLIYPNTVEKVVHVGWDDPGLDYSSSSNETLKTVVLSKNLKTIDDGAFLGCTTLSNITIPDNVTTIGELAFCYCYGLTSITIPESMTSIGTSAFYDCISLKTVNYKGTEEQWNEITISYGNTNLTNATINYLK